MARNSINTRVSSSFLTLIVPPVRLVAAAWPPEPAAEDAPPSLNPRNQPEQRITNARRRRLYRFFQRGEPQREVRASRGPPD
jgi:hypothetical protein